MLDPTMMMYQQDTVFVVQDPSQGGTVVMDQTSVTDVTPFGEMSVTDTTVDYSGGVMDSYVSGDSGGLFGGDLGGDTVSMNSVSFGGDFSGDFGGDF
jgi:hypothetical protein